MPASTTIKLRNEVVHKRAGLLVCHAPREEWDKGLAMRTRVGAEAGPGSVCSLFSRAIAKPKTFRSQNEQKLSPSAAKDKNCENYLK